jgi:hypothetical protein
MTQLIATALRHARAAYDFVLDVKVGYDLGRTWPAAISIAWSLWGWRV